MCPDTISSGSRQPPAGGPSPGQLAGVLRAAKSVALVAVDSAGVVCMFNSGAERLFGYSAAEVVGRMRGEDFHLAAELEAYARKMSAELGREIHGARALVERVLQLGPAAVDRYEWTCVHRDGTLVPVEITMTGVYDPRGHLSGYLGIVEDLRDRKALRADLRRAQISVDNAADMILWTRMDGRIAFCNRAACEALGYGREELLRLAIMDVDAEITPEKWREHCSRLPRVGGVTVETSLRRRDGSISPVEVTASRVEHEGQVFCLGIVRDIAERRALLAQLHQARLCVDNAEDMILWLRLEDGRIVFANRAACRTLGYSAEELVGLDAGRINPAARDAPDGLRATCAQLGHADRTRFETTFRRSNGSTLPVEVNATRVVHAGGAYAVGIARDVTERRRAESRLRAEMRLSQSLAESARALLGPEPDIRAIARRLLDSACAFTASRDGYVALIDREGGDLRLLALRSGAPCAVEAGGRAPGDGSFGHKAPGAGLPYPGLWGRSLNTLRGFFSNRAAGHRGLPDGHLSIMRLLAAPAVSKGRLVGQILLANSGRDYVSADLAAVESLADIFALGVEQVLSQRALRAAKDAAEAASQAKTAFLTNMTHEVHTPLNGILGMLQVLLAGELSPEQRENVGVAMESAERLHRLLDDVMEFARLDADLSPSDCLRFPPQDVLRSLEARFAPRAREKGLEFSTDFEPGLPEFMFSDPRAVDAILGHLLDNAVKFTKKGSVRLSAAPAGDVPPRIAFSVADTGIGIAPGQRERVFNTFAQADESITRTYGGAGLGLAIASRQAARLGGSLAFSEGEGGGTVMIVTLPADCSPLLPA